MPRVVGGAIRGWAFSYGRGSPALIFTQPEISVGGLSSDTSTCASEVIRLLHSQGAGIACKQNELDRTTGPKANYATVLGVKSLSDV